MPSVIMRNVVMLSVIMLTVVMLSLIMRNVVMLSLIMLNVVMLSVVAPAALIRFSTKLSKGALLPLKKLFQCQTH
jgi:hypothetical protein